MKTRKSLPCKVVNLLRGATARSQGQAVANTATAKGLRILVVVRGTAAFSGALGDYHSDNPSVSTNHRHPRNGCRGTTNCVLA
jgi:hypothetical protein